MIASQRKLGALISWANEKATYIGENIEDCVTWITDYWMAK